MSKAESADFFRQPVAQMIALRYPLAVLASRLCWAQIEAALAPHFTRKVREGRAVAQDDLFGPSLQFAGAGVAAAGRPSCGWDCEAFLRRCLGGLPCSQQRSQRPSAQGQPVQIGWFARLGEF